MRSPLILVFSATVGAAFSSWRTEPVSYRTGGPKVAAATPELHQAPEPDTGESPPEAILTPPPDAEKAIPTDMVRVPNPAFPAPPTPDKPVETAPGRRFTAADFTPHFANGALAEAKAAFDRGDFGRAKKLLNGTSALSARYLRALSAMRAEDWSDAAPEMRDLADAYPPLRDRCLFHGATAYEKLKKLDESARLFAGVPPDSRLFSEARLGLSRVLRASGDKVKAGEALAPLAALPAQSWGRDLGAEALLILADLAKERKAANDERDALIRLWSRHPLSDEAKEAEKRLKKTPLPLEASVTRAESLIDANRNKQGLSVLEPLMPQLKLGEPLGCRGHFLRGKGLRKERRHTEAIAVLSPMVEKCTDPALRPRALYVLGSSRSIVDTANGAETYEELAGKFPDQSLADDALFFAADLYEKNGHKSRALERLAQIVRQYPQGDFAAEALFKTFWIHRDAKDTAKALAALEELEKKFAKDSYELERSLYWRARVLEETSDKARAVSLYERLTVEHPTGYYGLISRERLRALDEGRAKAALRKLVFTSDASPWPLESGTLDRDPHFHTAVELLRLGFPEAVSSELLAVNRTNQPQQAIRLIVQILAMAGDSRSAHGIARVSLRQSLSGRIESSTRPVWEVAYPNAFRELIERHCKAASVDPDLLQALMREESALDPQALSWAGALGLTQLMLPTAKSVARSLKLNVRRITQTSLLQPDLNIRLGATYLGSLLKQFNGNTAYALAGYNAGSGAVRRWREAYPSAELDEWVEQIPIAETRGYVKRVLRTYNTYQLLYGRTTETGGDVSAAPKLSSKR
jgi:soluble lytic murein transglycosylase